MDEYEAISQFVTITDNEKCGKCSKRIHIKYNIYPDRYFDAPYNKLQIELCESCFDGMIKYNQGFY
jgi:hypothetical protein